MKHLSVLIFLIVNFSVFAQESAESSKHVDTQVEKRVETKTISPWKKKDVGDLSSVITEEYAWDQFNHQGHIIWACRIVQSGDFVDDAFCLSKDKVDTQWPSKATPPNWKE